MLCISALIGRTSLSAIRPQVLSDSRPYLPQPPAGGGGGWWPAHPLLLPGPPPASADTAATLEVSAPSTKRTTTIFLSLSISSHPPGTEI
jgi:hypothetical protein